MAGFQFITVEHYSYNASKDYKRQSARNVAAEADRFALACPHINNLRQPVRLYGCSANEAVDEAEKIFKSAKDKLGRKIRKDANILLAGVTSYPVPIAELTPNDESLKIWIKLNLQFFREKYGELYKSAIAHVDEKYFHIHFFVLPEVNENNVLNFASIHDGIRARESVSKLGAKAKVRAYSEAMRSFQDEYYAKVGIPCGLTREGPKRRRLTRKEWMHEQKTAERLANAESRIKQIQRVAKKIKLQQLAIRKEKGSHNTFPAVLNLESQNIHEKSTTYNNKR
ncbi:plasmid recombination protein [Vibrio fluvialis]